MSNYRKIWENVNGTIPHDLNERRMEIHHIDGNRENNEIDNLRLVSIDEHYNIHYEQNDWAACQSIINRMNVSPEEKSKSCSELAKKRFAEGTHHFQDPNFIKEDSMRKSIRNKGAGNPMFGRPVSEKTRTKQSLSQKKLVTDGKHHLQSEKHKVMMRDRAKTELQNGTHPFQQSEVREKQQKTHTELVSNKKHPFNSLNRIDPNKTKVFCEVCNKETTLPAFNRFHKH